MKDYYLDWQEKKKDTSGGKMKKKSLKEVLQKCKGKKGKKWTSCKKKYGY